MVDLSSVKQTIYISVDVEADGPYPVFNNLLSIGAYAYIPRRYHVNRFLSCWVLQKLGVVPFSCNVEPQPRARADEETMEFWYKNEENLKAYEATFKNRVPVATAMKRFITWLEEVRQRAQFYATDVDIVFLAAPAGYDYTFIRMAFAMAEMQEPFANKVLDIQSYLAGARGSISVFENNRSRWLASWFNPQAPHTHIAVEDSLHQGEAFKNIFEETVNNTRLQKLALRQYRKETRFYTPQH